jgi:hypothetical protein
MPRQAALVVWGIGSVLLLLALAYGSLLLSQDPLGHPLSTFLPWPVACSTRDCITTTQWQRYHAIQTTFAQATGESPRTAPEVLTTLLRQHLVEHAFLQSPVSLLDAQRYRTDVLHLPDDKIKELTTLTPAEYDALVVVPFLEQEALRTQLKVESTDELYVHLSRSRWIGVFPKGWWWNRERALVETK